MKRDELGWVGFVYCRTDGIVLSKNLSVNYAPGGVPAAEGGESSIIWISI
jgi:hypothetical protein